MASVLVFLGIRAIPGSPALVLADGEHDPALLAAISHEYLLDRPLTVQYGRWLWLTLHGNLGRGESGLPVAHTIVERLPTTLELASLSLVVALLAGVSAGVVAAAREGTASDYAVRILSLVGLSVPHFWLGLLLIIWFAVDLHWLPATGYATLHHPIANLRHMVLPCVTLGSGLAAILMRQTRSAMLDALGADFVRTARAKGVGEWRVLVRHALRGSLITVTTIVALDFGALVSGAAVTETVFGVPGYGKLAVGAIGARDYPLIQGIVLVTAAAFVLTSLAADVLYSLLDPRIRIDGAGT